MKTYKHNENRHDYDGVELDGKHIFPFGYLIYADGKLTGGHHDVLGEVSFQIHKTKNGSGLFGRFHFEHENEQLNEMGVYESNLDGYFLSKESFFGCKQRQKKGVE